MSLSFLVADQLIDGVDAILGMDIIRRLGGVYVDGNNSVSFVSADGACVSADGASASADGACVSADGAHERTRKVPPIIDINDPDFVAAFDGVEWTIRW